MSLLLYLFLGFIQGITEPIPVSSSGHILIFKTIIEKVFNGTLEIDLETFATMTNFGSFLAIALIFRKQIVKLVKAFFTFLFTKETKVKKANKKDFMYCMWVIVATIPAGFIGLIVSKLDVFAKIEENTKFVGVMLLVTALCLYLIKDFKGKKDNNDITLKDSIIIGLFQVVALLPGISRSGATIVGGMTRDLKRETAFDFSFMLYLPISIATMILGVKDLVGLNLDKIVWVYYMLATTVAFLFTYFATLWFRDIVKKGKLQYFSIYCVIVGILVIIFL